MLFNLASPFFFSLLQYICLILTLLQKYELY
jgi:hypothetical protein